MSTFASHGPSRTIFFYRYMQKMIQTKLLLLLSLFLVSIFYFSVFVQTVHAESTDYMPTGLTVINGTPSLRSVVLSWKRPTTTDKVRRYDIYGKVIGGNDVFLASHFDASSLQRTINGLPVGVPYSFSVIAYYVTASPTRSVYTETVTLDTNGFISTKEKNTNSSPTIITPYTFIMSTPVVATQNVTPASNTYLNTNQFILRATDKDITIRGYIQSIDRDTFTLKTWGGVWTVQMNTLTTYTPQNIRPELRIGDYAGVKGTLSQSSNFTVIASEVRNRTLYP